MRFCSDDLVQIYSNMSSPLYIIIFFWVKPEGVSPGSPTIYSYVDFSV